MVIQKSYVEEATIFLRLTSIILVTWAVTFLLSLVVGTICLGHIPVYGIDKDPNSLNSFLLDTIYWINFLSFFFSFFAFFAWPFLLMHLLIYKVVFSYNERLLQAGALLSILTFFMFKLVWAEQFSWHYD